MNYLEMVIKAVEEDSFVGLFRGDDEYSLYTVGKLPADIPIDWAAVLRNGIYELYITEKNEKIPKLCEDALYTLMNGNAFDVWCAFNVCFFLAYHYRKQDSPFQILNDKILGKLHECITREKSELRNFFCWQGKQLFEGLWTDIISAADIAEKKYDVNLIETCDLGISLCNKITQYLKIVNKRGGSVRGRNIYYPSMNCDIGDYAMWDISPAQNTPTGAELELFYGVQVCKEFQSYISQVRFVELELQYGNLQCNIFPLAENKSRKLNLLPAIEINKNLYYVIGTAYNEKNEKSYGIMLRNNGGIYILEDGTHTPIFLTSSIARFFYDSEV